MLAHVSTLCLCYTKMVICCAALHPVYGLIWTNGKEVFLASVDIVGDKLKSVSSAHLAVFE